jgi:hypothetical protein
LIVHHKKLISYRLNFVNVFLVDQCNLLVFFPLRKIAVAFVIVINALVGKLSLPLVRIVIIVLIVIASIAIVLRKC